MSRISKLSKFQKIILVYIGIKANNSKQKYIKRTDVSIGLKEKLAFNGTDSFRVVLTNAINALYRRKLVSRMRSTIRLTEVGKTVASETLDEVKKKYKTVDWKLIKRWYDEE